MKPHEQTAGITDHDLGPPAGLLPQDSEPGTCYRCGRRGRYPTIIRTILRGTNEAARRCGDGVECIRRDRKARLD